MQKHIFKGTEKIKKKYEVVFKIWAKKKSGPTIPSVNIESGGDAWEPGGVGEKATYRHASRTLIPLRYRFFLTIDFLNLRYSDPPIFRCFEFPNFRFTKLPKY